MDRFELYYRLSLIWLGLLMAGFTFVLVEQGCLNCVVSVFDQKSRVEFRGWQESADEWHRIANDGAAQANDCKPLASLIREEPLVVAVKHQRWFVQGLAALAARSITAHYANEMVRQLRRA